MFVLLWICRQDLAVILALTQGIWHVCYHYFPLTNEYLCLLTTAFFSHQTQMQLASWFSEQCSEQLADTQDEIHCIAILSSPVFVEGIFPFLDIDVLIYILRPEAGDFQVTRHLINLDELLFSGLMQSLVFVTALGVSRSNDMTMVPGNKQVQTSPVTVPCFVSQQDC